MEKKVTVQAIADALGLSRNTVSKALNNKGALAEDTRQKILDKAAEMGYRRVIYISEPSPAEKGEIKELALITQNMPYGSHFGTYALNTFQERMSKNNYRLSMFPVRDTEIASLSLPIGFNKEKNEVIVGVKDEIYKKEMYVTDINLLLFDEIKEKMKVNVKTRYSSKEEPATIQMIDNNTMKVEFENPVARITPGQSAVFYLDDIVVGGGKII